MSTNQFCKNCLKKPACKKLCKELEEHLKKDVEIKQRELLISDFPENSPFPDWPSSIYLTKTEKQILTLFGKGLLRNDVCQILKITRHSLRTHLINLKKKSKKY